MYDPRSVARQHRHRLLGVLVAASAVASLSAAAGGTDSDWHHALEWQGQRTSVEVQPLEGDLRLYRFLNTDAAGASRERTVTESQSRVRTGNALFDGLYALALAEAREDSVEQITDGQFNAGEPIPCHCFETGAKWPYVWTRDISYSVDLGLALLDPVRALNSLLFKQSALRPELLSPALADAQVVAQDTGSGGSWPISTDRVVWIHAASDLLGNLSAELAAATATQVLRIAGDTLAQDRRLAFDARAGLYRGETSFLDWREQTYPAWTRAETLFIAEGFALSTNVLHFVALQDAAQLARRAGDARAAGFSDQAIALRVAINRHFWVPRAGLYSSYLSRDLSPAQTYDLLGLSLAVIHGVADARQARSILVRYPLSAAGAPVVWPGQPGIAIYHNRAIWPFVTAYALQAARLAHDPLRMTAHAESLLRGAAMSLSNYENYEFLTQQPKFDDGALSGPVINSPRQLWSVAAYLGMVVHELFGVHVAGDGAVTIAPSVPGALARRLFAHSHELSLQQLAVRGRLLSVTLALPEAWNGDDRLEAAELTVDGRRADLRRPLPPGPDALAVRVTLRAMHSPAAPLHRVGAANPHALTAAEQRALFAPTIPTLTLLGQSSSSVELAVAGVAAGNTWQIERDGVVVASGTAGVFSDHPKRAGHTLCYGATQAWPNGGHGSLPSRELCVPRQDSRRTYAAGPAALSSPDGHALATSGDANAYLDWGTPPERLELGDTATATGLQRLSLVYRNGYGPVNTGITAAVKEVIALCPSHTAAQLGVLVMPHLADPSVTSQSTSFVYGAKRGERCRIVIGDGLNMSYLQHFTLYTGGRGGRDGAWNRADVVGATVDSIAGQPLRCCRFGRRGSG